ncbi:MAG: alkaline phosphatase [Planctomycetes bacterium]|nr:alkaline phosphatase [Planctomycetota bacterium]
MNRWRGKQAEPGKWRRRSIGAVAGGAVVIATAFAAPEESARQWLEQGRAAVEAARRLTPITGKAKNVILFVGDGMGIATITAARILDGQRRGRPGEENALSFETLPYAALIKTYNTNQQTPDSAGTMSAMVTGVKTKAGVLSVDQEVTPGDHTTARGHELPTILELAERAGLSTGVVTTTTVTHATPAACYAHSVHRDWEDDSRLGDAARAAGYPDIARQLIEFSAGNGLEVALGGGRSAFLPTSTPDPEDEGHSGRRLDGRDLTAEWLRGSAAAYVWNAAQFEAVDPTTTDHLLGLFERSHMEFECDRSRDKSGEPSLSEMTAKALAILARNPKGYFLMVEGGRIDHGHHAANAYRALTDTIEFAAAVRTAMDKTDRRETLIIVTADHSHVFTLAGYPTRGNPILGKVINNDESGTAEKDFAHDALGLTYTTLGYANGPGYAGASEEQPEGAKRLPHFGRGYRGVTTGRPDLSSVDTQAPQHLFECTVPLGSETHGGEDVVLFADGPQAHLFHGVLEQNVIFHVMVEALGLER